jgi:hypothetical protein
VSWLVPGDIILGMTISATDLSDSWVSSSNQTSWFPGWNNWWSTTKSLSTQWWWGNPPM